MNNSPVSLLNGTALCPGPGPVSPENLLAACGHATFGDLLTQLGWLFYIVSPNSSSYLDYREVPNYELQFVPIFIIILLFEQAIRFCQGKAFSRASDLAVNTGSGSFFLACRVGLLGVVMKVFYFFYDNYRIVDLAPTALSTWIFSLLLVEFVYYWVHRSLHEINLFWAGHQFHHNAVEIDVSTTIRDSVVDLVIYEFFPAPLALIIPPPILLVHMQFSLIYQIWLHNEVVGHLGPLEYIINTPRQHRVHHGRNRYCIDKNYGALLMIWDRLFGTYQAEQGKIHFGTTAKGYETFDAATLNVYYYYDVVWSKFVSMGNWSDKMKVLFYGPGWAPGKPRTGLLEDIPEVEPDAPLERYDREIPFVETAYVMSHLSLIGLGFYLFTNHPLVHYSPLNALYIMLYFLFALTTFGAIFDRRPMAPLVESFRCLLFFAFDITLLQSWIAEAAPSAHMGLLIAATLTMVRLFHLASLLFWVLLWAFRLYLTHNTASNDTLNCGLKRTEKPSRLLKHKSRVNERTAWQYGVYLVSSLLGLTMLTVAVGLRHLECSHLLQYTFQSNGIIA